MTSETKKVGNLGEEIAVKYLKRKGYNILDKNFRYKGYGEIDIVAQNQNKDIVFIEVKTRDNYNNDIYIPEDNITYFKRKQLIKLAKIYLAKHLSASRQENSDIPWQIDIIAVEINHYNNKVNLRHIEQAIQDFY